MRPVTRRRLAGRVERVVPTPANGRDLRPRMIARFCAYPRPLRTSTAGACVAAEIAVPLYWAKSASAQPAPSTPCDLRFAAPVNRAMTLVGWRARGSGSAKYPIQWRQHRHWTRSKRTSSKRGSGAPPTTPRCGKIRAPRAGDGTPLLCRQGGKTHLPPRGIARPAK
jgi:hypothetical protein